MSVLSEHRISTLGWASIRRYVHGIEALCKEIRVTNDPRVCIDGLRAIKLAMTQIVPEELGGLKSWERRAWRDLRAPQEV